MSHVIDSITSSQLGLKPVRIPRSSFNFQTIIQALNSLNNTSQTLKEYKVQNEKYEILFQIHLLKHLPVVVKKITIDRKRLFYQSKFIFKIQSKILCCLTKQLRLLLIKEIESFRKKMRVHSYVITVDQNTGQLIGKQIFTLAPQTNLIQLLTFQLAPMKSNIIRFISTVVSLINAMPPLFIQYLNQTTKSFNEIVVQDKIENRAYKYLYYNIISYWASLTDSTSQSYEEPQDRLLYERLIKEKQKKLQQGTVQLYSHLPKNRFKTPYKFQIAPDEQNNFRIHLKVPLCQTKKSQSNFIFNQIMIVQDSYQTADSGLRGAKTKILLSKLKFFYHNGLVNPNQNHNNREIARKQYTKLVAIKVPIQKPATQELKNKEAHQIKILKIFSLKQSPFLLRYFVCQSQKFKYSNMLMMNFAGNCDTISSFFGNRKQTMSLTSKLFILINVLQSLRLIKDYEVVHMDLSPGNIIVSQNYIPQLIDFGESYSKDICQKQQNYNPGYTLPFTFPEKFTHKQFTSKSDMFSFAVLLFYLLFKSVPYNPTQKLVKSLKNFTYLDKYFFAPESVQYYGYWKIMIYIFSFIQRCLDPNLIYRPYPEWAIITFKELYFWLDEIQMMIS